VGHGWEVVEKYISGQKNYTYEKTNIPVVMVDEEKEKPLKIGYVTLYGREICISKMRCRKNRKAFIYSRTDKNKVAEPDISAGLLFSGSVLKYGV